MHLNRLLTPPPANSPAMRAYMAGLLEVSGMISRQGFPLETFLGNLSTHMKPKAGFPHATLRKVDGVVYVTEEGHGFFSSRLTSSPLIKGQQVSRSQVIDMIRNIVAPTPPLGWQSVELQPPEAT